VIPAPDSYRVPPERLSQTFAGHVTAAIADLEKSGVGFSALLVDSIFSSDGVFADPPGFMRAAVEAVHRAGGMFIADEVQCGFGRTGSAFWGFERHGVLPDVVTLGKPMGNGYPMGAVVTRPEILDAFCARFGYFNTFAGSPVAAAVGQAVFDVIQRENLMENALRTGGHLRGELHKLALRHPAIVDVRGAGLYIGVELGEPAPDTVGSLQPVAREPGAPVPAPAQALTKAVLNGLRERRVLIGAAGRGGNVLKIRPPLCFSAAHADQLVAALDDTLARASAAAYG
jgi:4-aminobutyrate aminotransferase-like enzyme